MNFLKRIYSLLLPKERKDGGKVVAAVFVTALLDFVGLASLLPVLSAVHGDAQNHIGSLGHVAVILLDLVVDGVHRGSLFSPLGFLSVETES